MITNGAVRDLPGVSRMQFPMFAPAVSVSHAYMHMVDFGAPVEIFGLAGSRRRPAYADSTASSRSPSKSLRAFRRRRRHPRQEQQIIDICQSPDFSLEKLLKAVQNKQ